MKIAKKGKSNNNNNKPKPGQGKRKTYPAGFIGPLPQGMQRATSVLAPVARGTVRQHNNTVAQIRVKKRERFATLVTTASGTGVVGTWYVNAGNMASSTNSYLARQAQLFDHYRFHKLSFHYVPIVSTATAGNLIMGADMDAQDITPTDSFGMTNLSLGYSEGNVWAPQTFNVDVSKVKDQGRDRIVRSTTNQLVNNAVLFDTCSLYAFVEGTPANTTLGYVDIEYDVSLKGVNRNANPGSNSISVIGAATVKFAGVTITPGGLYANTVFASFQAINFNTPNTPANFGGTGVVTSNYGSTSNVTGSTNGFTLAAGTYEITLVVTIVSDTYANGRVLLSGGSENLAVWYGTGAGTAPATSYINSGVVQATRIVTLATSTAFALTNIYQYSAASTVNKTWNICIQDTNGYDGTYVLVKVLA